MNAAMEKTSREKIALIVFLILAIGMGFILFGYVFAGHSWNVTASNIDDAFGNMDGYTAIVYEGTIEEEESVAQSTNSAASAANSKDAGGTGALPADSKAGDGQASSSDGNQASSSDGNQASSSDGNQASSSDGNQASASSSESGQASPAASSSNKQAASSNASSNENSASSNSASAQENGSANQGVSTASEPVAAQASASESVAGEGASATVSPDGTSDSQASSAAPLAGHKKEKEPVALSDVDELYQAKGANVLSLSTGNIATYEEGTILKRGGKRYGIFSVTHECSRILIDEKVKYFTDQKVDYVIALCPEESYLKNAENIDIVITTKDAKISSMGESRNGVFYVSTPKVGSVGAILISPSNVVSAKTISEL